MGFSITDNSPDISSLTIVVVMVTYLYTRSEGYFLEASMGFSITYNSPDISSLTIVVVMVTYLHT